MYSQSYLRAVNSYKNACGAELLSIESLADLQTSHPLIVNLLDWASCGTSNSPQIVNDQSWNSSGASGRSFAGPVNVPSRRYATNLRKQAITSTFSGVVR